jgi:hypothetical protein
VTPPLLSCLVRGVFVAKKKSCDDESKKDANRKSAVFIALCLGACLYCRFFVKAL